MDEAMERIRSHQDTLDCHIGSEDVRKRFARIFFVHSTFASFYIVLGGQYSEHLSHRPWLILFCSARFCVVISSSGQCQVNRGAYGAKAPGPPKAGAHLAAIINNFFIIIIVLCAQALMTRCLALLDDQMK